MTAEQMKKIYESEPNNWAVYYRFHTQVSVQWCKSSIGLVEEGQSGVFKVVLIHKRHEHIADKVIRNPDVVVEVLTDCLEVNFDTWQEVGFFKDYEPELEYRLAPTKQEPKGEEDGRGNTIKHSNSDVDNSMESSRHSEDTISITDEQGKEYKFEKPEFECELLKVRTTPNEIIGTISLTTHEVLAVWGIGGGCVIYDTLKKPYLSEEHNLTPIKPKWYEDKDMIGKYAITTDTNEMFIVSETVSSKCVTSKYEFKKGSRKDTNWCDVSLCRPATKDEVLALYYEDKE